MNIKEAKTEIVNTLRAYHRRDEEGNYCYPAVRQRPILLMGPPGIGKTAIMEQVVEECGVGLVSYTITHHTRQSAIGLPRIETKIYDGKPVSVTEYTLSEIIASVYDCMERTGKREGILFIDEINCASETLAPTMLQFLQNKTFGSHRVPEGWMIVAAGNPPEYNKSVREFDIVTLDRVRRIDVEEDCGVWMEYAWGARVHGAILSYLGIKPENFYRVENTADGKFFVTARGWEDLSEILKHYEALGVEVTKALTVQYLQKEEVAGDFAAYYQLYRKYGTDYGVPRILDGSIAPESYAEKVGLARAGSFEERFTVVSLVVDHLNGQFYRYETVDERCVLLFEALKHLKTFLRERDSVEYLETFIGDRRDSLRVRMDAELLGQRACEAERWVIARLEEYHLRLRGGHIRDAEEGFECIRAWFQEDLAVRSEIIAELQGKLERAFAFVEDCFGQSQEMVLFVSDMTRNSRAMRFISAHGSEGYLRHSEQLLYRKRERELLEECRELL